MNRRVRRDDGSLPLPVSFRAILPFHAVNPFSAEILVSAVFPSSAANREAPNRRCCSHCRADIQRMQNAERFLALLKSGFHIDRHKLHMPIDAHDTYSDRDRM